MMIWSPLRILLLGSVVSVASGASRDKLGLPIPHGLRAVIVEVTRDQIAGIAPGDYVAISADLRNLTGTKSCSNNQDLRANLHFLDGILVLHTFQSSWLNRRHYIRLAGTQKEVAYLVHAFGIDVPVRFRKTQKDTKKPDLKWWDPCHS